MKNTGQNILDKAREMFNRQGVQSTTLRQIATGLGMSQGNLNYHFKTKSELIEALYFELVAKMDVEMSAMSQGFSLLSTAFLSAEKSITIFYEYRFILRDMYSIFRENEKLKQHYVQLQELRAKQFKLMFDTMIEQGILRKPEIPKEYERLYERMNIVGDNWINPFELFGSSKHSIAYYNELLFEMIYPYLSESGKKEYRALVH